MTLDYTKISENEDVNRNRTVIEEAKVPGEGLIIRTTVYTAEGHMARGATFVPVYDTVNKHGVTKRP